jgi:hypothetical protein
LSGCADHAQSAITVGWNWIRSRSSSPVVNTRLQPQRSLPFKLIMSLPMTLHSSSRDARRKPTRVRRTPSPLVAALISTQRQPVHVGQTLGQPNPQGGSISEPAHAPDATIARIPKQRFCPDTEEVTGSISRAWSTQGSSVRGPVMVSTMAVLRRRWRLLRRDGAGVADRADSGGLGDVDVASRR